MDEDSGGGYICWGEGSKVCGAPQVEQNLPEP
jgi:hypothetical protein